MAKPELEQRFEELSVVAEVSSAMLSPLELDQVLRIAVEKVSRALGAHSGSITLLSADGSTMEFAAVYNLVPEYAEQIQRAAPLSAASSPSGRAVLTRQPYVVADTRSDPLFAPWRELAEAAGYRSMICVPLPVAGQPIGTLNQYLAEPHQFSEREVRLLTVVAQQVSLAVERARLYQQERSGYERKCEFLTAMSHELRAPLTAILGFTEVLLTQVAGPLNEQQQRSIRILSSSAQHLMMLINDVLDTARLEAGKLECAIERVDLSAVIAEVLSMMQPLAQAKRLALEWQRSGQPLAARADRQKCKQILVNLVSNAIKFTPRGEVRISGSQDANRARISVCDTGIGVRPEDLPLLFRDFQQLRAPQPENWHGAGLGLAISRKLARRMGGDIEVESSYGRGSTFTLTLEAG